MQLNHCCVRNNRRADSSHGIDSIGSFVGVGKMKCVIPSAVATMLIAGAATAGCHTQQVVAAQVAYPQAIIAPVFQPVVAQYPVVAPVIQQQAFYAQPVVVQQVLQKQRQRVLFQKQPRKQTIITKQRIVNR